MAIMMKMIKIWLLGLLWGLPAIGTAVAAPSQEYLQKLCREEMAKNPPQIVVEYNFGQLKYDFSKSEKELAAMFKEINPQAEVFGKVHGVTRLTPAVTMETKVMRQMLNNSSVCIMPSDVHIRLGYNEPTVFILNTLQEGSCRYKLAMRHEQAHLDIGHAALALVAHAVKRKLPQVVEERGVYVTNLADSANLAEQMNAEYQSRLAPIVQIFLQTLMEQQAVLDTKENYTRESELCR